MAKIKSIIPRQILDSRGNPTVEVDLVLDNGILSRASVPSGASTGSREAIELRDGKSDFYLGKSVLKAVENIKTKLSPALLGKEVTDQKLIDQTMLDIDGTENKSNIGAFKFSLR